MLLYISRVKVDVLQRINMDKSYLVIGTCGTGKTWIMKQLIEYIGSMKPEQIGLYHLVQNPVRGVAILGKYDGTVFEGGDRLAMNIMSDNAKVKLFLDNYITIAEGDRFTNNTYINFFKPTVLRIKGDGAEGRAKRGSEQTERHIKSMTTRVSNITPHFEFINSEHCYKFIINELNGRLRYDMPYIDTQTSLF